MSGALFWLIWRSGWNRGRRMLRRFREPRRAIAIAVGIGYLTWAIHVGGSRTQNGAEGPTELALALGSVGLLISVLSSWFSGAGPLPLGFTAPEVAFLLPAPISRRGLLQYKLTAIQITIVLNAVVWTLLTAGSRVSAWQRGVAVWLLFTVLTLHRHVAGVLRGAARDVGTEGQRRAVAGLSFALIAAALMLSGGAGNVLSGGTGIASVVRAFMEQPWIAIPLWPFRTLLAPLMSPIGTDRIALLAGPAVILGLHVVALFLVDRVAEESVVRASLRRLEQGEAGPDRAPPPPAAPIWDLGPRGHDWAALIWLHVTTGVRRPRLLALLGFGIAILAGIALLSARSHIAAEVIGAMALVWGAFVFAFGPQYLRNDLRSELGRLALRRAWPIAGSTQVTCAVLSAALLLVPLVLWFLAAARIGLGAVVMDVLPLDLVWPAAMLVLPALCWLALLVQNGGAVLFPEWVAGTHGRGVEVLGLNLVVTALTLLFVALLAFLPATAAVVAWLKTGQTLAGSVLAGSIFIVGVALTSWPIVVLLGRQLDRLEPVAID